MRGAYHQYKQDLMQLSCIPNHSLVTMLTSRAFKHHARLLSSISGKTPYSHWHLNDEQMQYQQLAAQFAREQMLPFAAKWDEDKYLPVDVLKRAAQLGFASIYTDPEFGGSGLTRKDAVVIFEQLAQG